MRPNFGDRPDFAFSAGGLHPATSAPRTSRRCGGSRSRWPSSDNPRLRIEAYFAVTPATLQFGGRVELYYGVDIPLIGNIESTPAPVSTH